MLKRLRPHKRAEAGMPSDACKPSLSGQRTLTLCNRQHVRRVDLRLLRQIVQALLRETWPEGSFDLTYYFVAAPEMTRLNEAFLQHGGSTDVITFDYTERVGRAPRLSFLKACPRAGIGQAGRLSHPVAWGNLCLPRRGSIPSPPIPHHLAERGCSLCRSRGAAPARL